MTHSNTWVKQAQFNLTWAGYKTEKWEELKTNKTTRNILMD
jgi:hypothetical protein